MTVVAPGADVGARPGADVAGRRWAGRPLRAASLLNLAIISSFVLPARLVVPQLGAAGRPALLVSLGLFAIWCLHRAMGTDATRERQPVRVGAFLLIWTMLLTYAVGLGRSMPGIEARASDRFMLLIAGMTGLTLVTADGVRGRAELDALLRCVTRCTAFMSSLGLVAFATHVDPVSWITRLPGLELNAQLISEVNRGGFGRIAATATHPIEFGVVLGMVLPVALHHATTDAEPERRRSTVVAAIIAAGIPLSLARSGTIACVTGLVVLATAWDWRRRLNVAAATMVAIAAYGAVVPGLLGTLRGLFLNASEDGSVQVRLDDYEPALAHFSERPWLGQGPGTYLPDEYRQLDNQVLKFLLEVGVVGLAAVLAFLLLGVGLALLASRRARAAHDDVGASLGRALCGSLLAGVLVCATFDSFTYQIYDTVLFVFTGAAGVLWRTTARHHPGPQHGVAREVGACPSSTC